MTTSTNTKPVRTVRLKFDSGGAVAGSNETREFRASLSALVVLDGGRSLFIGGDETVRAEPSIERLSLGTDGSYAEHVSFAVPQLIDLPNDERKRGRIGEIDIEGMDEHDGYLWVTGSHCCNRKRPKPNEDAAAQIRALSQVDRQENRFFLGRIPLKQHAGQSALERGEGKARAARFKKDWCALLANDPHLGPFVRGIDSVDHALLPSKDNGLDIEGLAVNARSDGSVRLLLGLRGPVLRGFAVVLELRPSSNGQRDDRLELAALPGSMALYRKHFLDLGGLGVRDLGFTGEDCWILAGPTMTLEAPSVLLRWHAPFASPTTEDTITRLGDGRLTRELVLPSLGNGFDHPEAFAILEHGGSGGRELLVLYDSPAPERQAGETDVLADIFRL